MSMEKYSSTKGLYKEDEITTLVKIEITEKLRSKIDEFNHHLLKINYPYDTLCWKLAEFELIFESGCRCYSKHDVIEREKKIFDVSLDYEKLCWIITNFKVYLEEINLYP